MEGNDGTVADTMAGWPVLDCYARYQYAKGDGYDRLVTNTENYFLNEDAMREGSPQGILDRGEDAELPLTELSNERLVFVARKIEAHLQPTCCHNEQRTRKESVLFCLVPAPRVELGTY